MKEVNDMNNEAETYEMTTERLRLRFFTEQDANEVQKLCNNFNIYKTTLYIPHPYTVEDALNWMQNHRKNFEENKGYEFAITNKETGELLGAIGLSHNERHKQGELAYWVGEPFWNNGYGTEAAKAMLQFAFEVKGMHKVFARFFSSNPASGKIMEKIGMVEEGLLKEHVLKDGRFEDLYVYGILNTQDGIDFI